MTKEKKGLMAGIGAGVANTAMGMLLGGYNDNRQIRQQKKLQRQQIEGQKEMGEFNKELAMQMWRDTNYSAQMEEMKKAGINPGLMYGSAGSGGTTQTQAGSVSGANAPVGGGEINTGMGMQLGMQMAMMKAQKENIEADTANKKADATKKTGVDTENVGADTAKKNAETKLTEVNAQLAELSKQVKSQTVETEIAKLEAEKTKLEAQARTENVEASVTERTEDFEVQKIQAETEAAIGRAEREIAEGKVAKGTVQNRIHQIKQQTAEQVLRIKAAKEGIKVQQSTINKIKAEIVKMDRELSQKDAQLIYDKMRTEFSSGDEARVIRWIQTSGDAVNNIKGINGKTTRTRTDKGEDWSETTTTYK